MFSTFSSTKVVSDTRENQIEVKDYKSLEILADSIELGMTKIDVEKLVGAPHYSPAEGIYYYFSSDYLKNLESANINMGIVVMYHIPSIETQQVVKAVVFGPIPK